MGRSSPQVFPQRARNVMTADGLILQSPFALHRTATFQRTPKRPMDEAKFEAFYRKTAGKIWSYIFRMTGNASTADDLMQKTFFRFLRSNPEIADEDHLRRYVYKTATNLVFDHFREAKRDRAVAIEMPQSDFRADRGELRHD